MAIRHSQRRRGVKATRTALSLASSSSSMVLRHKKTPRKSPSRKQPQPSPSPSPAQVQVQETEPLENDQHQEADTGVTMEIADATATTTTTTDSMEVEQEDANEEADKASASSETKKSSNKNKKGNKIQKTASSSSSSKSKKNKKNKEVASVSDSDDVATPTTTSLSKPAAVFAAKVHRLRDLKYIPRPIVCMASYNPSAISSSSAGPASYVAVARENGLVDLIACTLKEHNPGEQHDGEVETDEKKSNKEGEEEGDDEEEQSKCQKSTVLYTIGHVAGSSHMVPHVMEWVVVVPPVPTATTTASSTATTSLIPPTCVAGSPDGTLWMVNFETSQMTSRIASGGGGVYGLAVLDKNGGGPGQNRLPLVAAACHDGSIRIYQVVVAATATAATNHATSPQRLEWVATLPSAGAALLSLTWTSLAIQKVQAKDSTTSSTQYDTVFFAGVADGTIRRYDVSLSVQDQDPEEAITSTSSSSMLIQVLSMKSTLRMTCDSEGRNFTTTKVWCLESWTESDEDESSNAATATHLVLVSGTSMGTVQFWNGQTGTLEQSIPHNTVHADVLCLQVSPNKCQLFVSGIDSRVACIERQAPGSTTRQGGASGGGDWKVTQAQRPHTHDVKAMVLCQLNNHNTTRSSSAAKKQPTHQETSSSSSSYLNQILLTGGLDTKICTYFTQQFSQHRPKVIHPWPTLLTTPIRGVGSRTSSNSTGEGDSAGRILLMQREGQVDLYRLKGASSTSDDDNDAKSTTTVLLGSIEMAGAPAKKAMSSNLVSSCISPNGQWVALCDATAMALFELVPNDNQGLQSLQPRQVELPLEVRSMSMVSLSFLKEKGTGISSLVAVDVLGQVHVLTIQEGKDNEVPRMTHAFLKQPVPTATSSSSSWPRVPIHFIASKREVSSSTKVTTCWMATLRHGSHNAIDIYQKVIRQGGDEKDATYTHFWTVPSLGSGAAARPTCICFLEAAASATQDPQDQDSQMTSFCLAVATASAAVYLFDVRQQRFHAWSEQRCVGDGVGGRRLVFPAPPLPIDPVVNHFNFCREYPVRLIANPKDPTKLIVGSFGTFCIIDLTKPLPNQCRVFPETHVRRRRHRQPKRKRSNSEADVHPHHQNIKGENDGEDPNSRNCTICLRYNSMLHLDFLEDQDGNANTNADTTATSTTSTTISSEMLVVEQPWLDVVATFPEALHRRIYGFN